MTPGCLEEIRLAKKVKLSLTRLPHFFNLRKIHWNPKLRIKLASHN